MLIPNFFVYEEGRVNIMRHDVIDKYLVLTCDTLIFYLLELF